MTGCKVRLLLIALSFPCVLLPVITAQGGSTSSGQQNPTPTATPGVIAVITGTVKARLPAPQVFNPSSIIYGTPSTSTTTTTTTTSTTTTTPTTTTSSSSSTSMTSTTVTTTVSSSTTTTSLAPVIVSMLRAGEHHAGGVTSNLGEVGWGANNAGQMGDGTTVNSATGVKVLVPPGTTQDIKVSLGRTCALISGGIWCWGSINLQGLGSSLVPTSLPGFTSGITAFATNHFGGLCAINSSGGVVCAGPNDAGQMGRGTWDNSSSDPIGAITGLSSGATLIGGGAENFCAVAGGKVSCWGMATNGQMGTNVISTTCNSGVLCSMIPVAVPGLPAGAIQDLRISELGLICVMINNGLYCWGNGADGELGNGTTTPAQTTPVSPSGLTSGVTNFALGNNHVCAVVNGGAMCWGGNDYGQLGLNNVVAQKTPQSVPSLSSGVVEVGTGSMFSCARTQSSNVWCWGEDDILESGPQSGTVCSGFACNLRPTLIYQ